MNLHEDINEAKQAAQTTDRTERKANKQSSSIVAGDVMQAKASNAAGQLAQVQVKAKEASLATSFKAGQKDAMEEAMAEQAGYLGAKVQLTVEATRQRIQGVQAIRANAEQQIVEHIQALAEEGEETDPLSLLSDFTGSNHALSLPSPFA